MFKIILHNILEFRNLYGVNFCISIEYESVNNVYPYLRTSTYSVTNLYLLKMYFYTHVIYIISDNRYLTKIKKKIMRLLKFLPKRIVVKY